MGLLDSKMDVMGIAQKNAYKEAIGKSIDAEEEVQQVRSDQGVTKGPQGPGSSKAVFIADQVRKGKDPALARRMADQIFGR